MNKKLFYFIYISFIINFSIQADVVLTWDDNILNGKITYIKYQKDKDLLPKLIIIKTSEGFFTIKNENLMAYWVTKGPEEDILIYNILKRDLNDDIKNHMKENYIQDKDQKDLVIEIEKELGKKANEQPKKKNSPITFQLNQLNRAGIILDAIGGSLSVAGVVVLTYDLISYRKILQDNLFNNPRDRNGYSDYLNSYAVHESLFISSIVVLSLGIAVTIIGIPLTLYQEKNKKVALYMGLKEKDVQFAIHYQF